MDRATLSVFRAAALLTRAPSNVTTRIQQLEAELGPQATSLWRSAAMLRCR